MNQDGQYSSYVLSWNAWKGNITNDLDSGLTLGPMCTDSSFKRQAHKGSKSNWPKSTMKFTTFIVTSSATRETMNGMLLTKGLNKSLTTSHPISANSSPRISLMLGSSTTF